MISCDPALQRGSQCRRPPPASLTSNGVVATVGRQRRERGSLSTVASVHSMLHTTAQPTTTGACLLVGLSRRHTGGPPLSKHTCTYSNTCGAFELGAVCLAVRRRPQLVYVRFLPRLEPEPSAAVTSARGRDGDVRCGKQTVALERREPTERPIKVSHSSLTLPLGSTTPLHNSVHCRASLVFSVCVFGLFT